MFKFPLLVSQIFTWLLDGNGNLTNAAIQQVVQPGDLIFSATGNGNTALRLLCDGSAVSRMTYPDLFLAIGTIYGPGDGSTTFNLPDYRARFPVGAGTGQISSGGAPAVSITYGIGQTGGEATHVLSTAEMPPHQHPSLEIYQQPANGNFQGSGPMVGSSQNDSTAAPFETITSSTGGDPANVDPVTGFQKAAVGHNTIPPFVACYIFVKT